jgi:hypothetical protein
MLPIATAHMLPGRLLLPACCRRLRTRLVQLVKRPVAQRGVEGCRVDAVICRRHSRYTVSMALQRHVHSLHSGISKSHGSLQSIVTEGLSERRHDSRRQTCQNRSSSALQCSMSTHLQAVQQAPGAHVQDGHQRVEGAGGQQEAVRPQRDAGDGACRNSHEILEFRVTDGHPCCRCPVP